MPMSPKKHKAIGTGRQKDERGTAASRGYDGQWQAVRLAYLSEQPLCEACLARGRTKPALDVDHIIPISKGGERLDPSNFMALCRKCHNRKTHGKEV